MIVTLKKALSESSDVSMLRLMAFLCVCCAVLVALVGLAMNKNLVELAALVSAFLVPAFGAKVVQSRYENTSAPQAPEQVK